MAFQLKSFQGVSAALINYFRANQTKVTDFNTGAVARTMLESAAIEIEELYLRMFIGLREAIPVSVYNTFGFDRLVAAKASGTIRFSASGVVTSAVPIPAGTAVRSPGKTLTYVTLTDAVIPVGGITADVLAVADTAGVSGNTGASTVTELVSSVSGVVSVSNPAPIINGRDEETDADRLTRFRAYVSSLARGTVSAVLYGAKYSQLKDSAGQVYEYVAMAALDEPWKADPDQPVGLVLVYIHNGASSTSVPLVAEAQRVIDGYYQDDGTPVPGWKAAGVKVVVASAADQSINIVGTISVDAGYTSASVIAAAGDAIRQHIQGLSVGVPVLKADLIAIIKRDVAGVSNVHITTPADDATVPVSAKAVPGTITLSAV